MSRIAIIRLQRASAFLPWPRATGKPGAPPSPPVARPFVNHPLEKRVWRRARRPASDETRTRVVRFPIDGLHGYL